REAWRQDRLGHLYLNHPHPGAAGFGGVAPQGALAAAGDSVVVPNGRAVPAVLQAGDGGLRYLHLAGAEMHQADGSIGQKQEGGSTVCTDGKILIVRRGIATTLYDYASGEAFVRWDGSHHPVLRKGVLYLGGAESVRAFRLDRLERVTYEAKGKDKKTGETTTVKRSRWQLPEAWKVAADASGDLILAGKHLYAAGKGAIAVIDTAAKPPAVVRTVPVQGTLCRLLAANDCLYSVSLEGTIACLGPGIEAGSPRLVPEQPPEPTPARMDQHPYAELAASCPRRDGWVLAYGDLTDHEAEALLTAPHLRLVCIAAGPARLEGLRAHLHARGLYGVRATAHLGDPEGFAAPPHIAALVLAKGVPAAADAGWIEALFASVRPYDGRLVVEGDPERIRGLAANASLPGAVVEEHAGRLWIRRQGPLPGAGQWTHLYANSANTAKSDDRLVRAPLGLLWFGSNSHMDVLPRHAHGPPELVLGGRLFIQGIDSLSARDVYTGAVLWKRTFSDLGTSGIYYDDSYRPDPLDQTYNQRHIPGTNARGTNLVAAPDALYLATPSGCLLVDPATGATRETFPLPPATDGAPPPEWAYLNVADHVLLGGTGFQRFSGMLDEKPGILWEDYDTTSSSGLVAMDRHNGALLWRREARLGFRHNAICAANGVLFCIDALPETVLRKLQRRGTAPATEASLLALDLASGAVRWEKTSDVFGTWLSCSAEHGLLVQGGAAMRDTVKGEPSERLMVLKSADGSVLWDRPIRHGGPLMIHGDTLYLPAVEGLAGAVSLLTGEALTRRHPLTRQPVPWNYHRRYGCGSVIASEFLLTFRSGTAGFCSLEEDSGTGNLGGFRSGCTSNLIAADGVLNAPDYTRTCTCSYQNQTSLALVPMADVDTWTTTQEERGKERILDLAINLGAPGDRRETGGPLWFEFPVVGGFSPELPVELEPPSPPCFYYHSIGFRGDLPWVAASGVEGEITVTANLGPAAEDPPTANPGPAAEDPPGPSPLYTLRLVFCEPGTAPSERDFEVLVQGQPALHITGADLPPRQSVVREIRGIRIADRLRIELRRGDKANAPPVLSGFALQAEPEDEGDTQ
ncbi:MAG: PQQ-binding-like beta-propeller repeat protein, partial [Lentisphaeria bacterium]|nr:PQQ-binding-like beta-propeller repeat protein [Lentisphaeria bacterium]